MAKKTKTRQPSAQAPILVRPAPFSIPEHAVPAYIEESRDGVPMLCLAIKSQTSPGGHTLRIPLRVSDDDSAGAKDMVKMLTKALSERRHVAPTARIGEPGVPLQAMLDALKTSAVKPQRAELTLEDLDSL